MINNFSFTFRRWLISSDSAVTSSISLLKNTGAPPVPEFDLYDDAVDSKPDINDEMLGYINPSVRQAEKKRGNSLSTYRSLNIDDELKMFDEIEAVEREYFQEEGTG